MNANQIELILKKQRQFFQSGKTLSIKFRIEMLRKLYDAVKKYECEIGAALKADLGKSDFEGFMCETGLVLSEISYMIKHVKKFSKPKKAKTPLAQFHSKSYRLPSPYGNTLIISPWNYPLLLTLDPLANSIAAGNTAIVKPSAYSPNTSELVKKIICECFDEEYIAVVLGGRAENAALLEQKFDLIFFTGSQAVGKEVLKKASEHLTPTILELGGKSPCIVDKSAKISLAAKRIVFGKYLNCGQTCVAPDYVLCHKSIKQEFLNAVKTEIERQFGLTPLDNENYGKIINQKHFDRLKKLIDGGTVFVGGGVDEGKLKIEPTVLDNVEWTDEIMKEEIFGPIMPILTFESVSEIEHILADKYKPLALYIFAKDKSVAKEVTRKLSFGGGCVNDTIIHLATSEMGFGGVGESGMGSYHGKVGFDAFSHTKSIVDKKQWLDLPMRYQPYKSKFFSKLLHIFLK